MSSLERTTTGLRHALLPAGWMPLRRNKSLPTRYLRQGGFARSRYQIDFAESSTYARFNLGSPEWATAVPPLNELPCHFMVIQRGGQPRQCWPLLF